MAARAEPMANVIEMVRLTLMPMRLSGGLILGHGAHGAPILVLPVKNIRPAMITVQATMVTSETALTLNLAKNSGTGKVTSEVKFLGVAPHRKLRGVLQEVRHADGRDQNGQQGPAYGAAAYRPDPQ